MANEVRLIDANALARKWQDVLDSKPDEKEAVAYLTFELFIERLKDEPIIDPESLKAKGRWELHGNDDDCGCSYFCSNCQRSYPEEWFWDHGKYVPFENCPHCTAKMEG